MKKLLCISLLFFSITLLTVNSDSQASEIEALPVVKIEITNGLSAIEPKK
jgi:hypothetical protein